jgi:hypothetical protein
MNKHIVDDQSVFHPAPPLDPWLFDPQWRDAQSSFIKTFHGNFSQQY